MLLDYFEGEERNEGEKKGGGKRRGLASTVSFSPLLFSSIAVVLESDEFSFHSSRFML